MEATENRNYVAIDGAVHGDRTFCEHGGAVGAARGRGHEDDGVVIETQNRLPRYCEEVLARNRDPELLVHFRFEEVIRVVDDAANLRRVEDGIEDVRDPI